MTWLNQIDATYRTDLRELNELNFARFDAKLEQRAAGLSARIDQIANRLDAKIDQRATELRAELHRTSASQYKWMFVFWAGTVLPLAGLMIALFQHFRA